MTIETEILQVLHYHPLSNRGAIASMLVNAPSGSTMKRLLADAVSKGLIEVYGKGPATKYSLTPQAQVTMPLDIDTYFKNEMDDRTVQENFNFELIKQILPKVSLFTEEECKRLDKAQSTFRTHLEELSETDYKKEMERLGVDLSWKSSQIEGNTYSLLETERLLKERQEATGKTREEAIMLLNHKALEDTCKLINGKDNIFEKSLLALVLLSYIQAFSDGNKRTARITSNAILIANGYCPISFRTVDSIDYKKAMLIFYEQNNIAAFKKIFIEQFEFAVKTYF